MITFITEWYVYTLFFIVECLTNWKETKTLARKLFHLSVTNYIYAVERTL